AYAKSQLQVDPELGFQLAARAANISPTDQAIEVLRESLSQSFLPTKLQGHTGYVTSAGFSPDGKWIVTASGDNTARVQETGSGRMIASLLGHTDFVNNAGFSPDGKWIVTASLDKTARIYPWEMFAPIEDVLALARKRVLRELTPEEREKYLHEPQS